MMVSTTLIWGLLLASCASSSGLHVGAGPRVHYRHDTALSMALDEEARRKEEALAKYLAKTNEEKEKALRKLEEEKEKEIRALNQKLINLLESSNRKQRPPSGGNGNTADSSALHMANNKVITWTDNALQAIKLQFDNLKQNLVSKSETPPVNNGFSSIDASSQTTSEIEALKQRLASLQNSVLNNNANDFSPPHTNFSPEASEMGTELEALRLRLARLKDQMADRLESQQQQQQRPTPPPSSLGPPGQDDFSDIDYRSTTTEVQALRSRLDDLLRKAGGGGDGSQ